MYIRPSDRSVLMAFCSALSSLSTPLPQAMQAELYVLADNLVENSQVSNKVVGQLDSFAERYSPLDDLYQHERFRLEQERGKQDKGKLDPPSRLPDRPDTSELVNMCIKISKSPDPVCEAQKNKSLIVKIWQSMTGKADE